MGRKNSASITESQPEEELEVQEQVQNKIKELPTLKQKVEAIAINSYMLEKRKLDKQMGSEITKIEIEQRKRYSHLIEQINDIVSGKHNYTDADFEGQNILNDEEDKAKNNYYKNEEFDEFWFKVLVQSDVTGQEVKEIDEALLKFLKRVTAVKESENNLKLVFTFAENEWFTNTTLNKEFELEGEQIKRSFGDEINWKQGKNITVKTIKKKGKKGKKTVHKEVESFFNFFKEIDLTSDNEAEEDEVDENDEEEEAEIQKLERQYQVANQLYETMIPKSLEYFLGVVGADFGNLADLGAMGEDFGDDLEDEEDLAIKKPKNKKSKGKAPRKGSAASNDSK